MNARPAANERSSTRERTLVDLLLLDDRSFHTGRPFVRWSTSVRSLMDERSFAGGRAFHLLMDVGQHLLRDARRTQMTSSNDDPRTSVDHGGVQQCGGMAKGASLG
ncbi:hypothetical protein LR48_Vigan617s000400 [Vigna angularis]|uniref:Uncharacterized protein n=1 Tax=Phaseolus angularis TaxID=3914 RepID=A0A0L9TE84_PHAAN|nr:hypothetical protein LR48_Vigan617s000400 [Vigna angularis]